MASELRQAVLEAGGRDHLCDSCHSAIDSKTPSIGLENGAVRDVLEIPNSIVKVRNKLKDVIDSATCCWFCGWMLCLLNSRRSDIFVRIKRADYVNVWLGSEPDYIRNFERGKTYASTHEDEKLLIEITFYIDAREVDGDFDGDFDTLLRLQQSSQHPWSISNLLDQTRFLNWPLHKPCEARIRPINADLRLCKRWKEHCLEKHGDVCNQTKFPKISDLRLIDVLQRCVIQSDANVPWVALSYCWGGPQVHSLRKENLTHYSTPGALTEEILPPLILDALEVIRNLGERYIWIDSLCILQDHEEDKAKYLSVMDAIYDQAILTIINAANGDTVSGLPGIRQSLSRRVQEPFDYCGTWVTENLDPPHESYNGYLAESTWNTRGWTFQEGLLSKRCLIFTADQIYWQCQTASWREGAFWEQDDELQIYRHFSGDNVLATLADPVIESWIPFYVAIVQKYNQRTFTSNGDVMHALNGVLRGLFQAAGEDHFWGLPISIMARGLTWTGYDFPKRRAAIHTYLNSQGEMETSPFPSWSWIGWISPRVDLAALQPSNDGDSFRLRFYRLDEGGTPISLPRDQAFTEEEKPPLQVNSVRHAWLDSSRQIITSADIPPLLAKSPLAPAILCFWTSTATLRIEQRGWNHYWNEPNVVLLDPNSSVGLSCRLPAGDFVVDRNKRKLDQDIYLGLPEYGKFVVVGSTRQRMSHGGNMVFTLILVEGGEEGVERLVCTRKFLFREVHESVWEKLSDMTRKWKLVFLV